MGDVSGTGGSSGGSGGGPIGASGGSSAVGGQTASGGSSSGGAAASGGSAGTASGGSATGWTGGAAGDACSADLEIESSGELHTHMLIVPLTAIQAGVDVTLITEEDGATHCHSVMLTASDLSTIASGGVVKKTTCSGGDHEFVISCSASAPAPVVPSTCGPDDNTGAAECPG